jgi:uncharacterized Zn finger protein
MEKDMDSLSFLVQGSAPEPYVVTFPRRGDNLTARCTCPAGTVGQYCKHRFAILAGDQHGVVSPNVGDIARVQEWLNGTDVEQALRELAEAEAEFDLAKQRVAGFKKKPARVLSD